MKDKNNLEPSDYIVQGCANTLTLNERETCVNICGQNFDYDNINDLVKDFQDLQEYRKIEDELGIDLITLFKAFKNGIYAKEINRITTVWKLVNDKGGTYLGAWHNDFEKQHNTIFLHLKDYGKTWALTKKELKND